MPYEPRWRRLQVRRRGDSGESRNRASEVLAAMVVQPRVMRAARNATPGTATAVATSPRRIVDPPVGGLGQRPETGCWRSLASAGRRATVGEHDGCRIRIDVGQVISY